MSPKPEKPARKGHGSGPAALPSALSFHGHIWTEMRLFPERASGQTGAAAAGRVWDQEKENGKENTSHNASQISPFFFF